MSLDPDALARVAHLARLHLPEAERAPLAERLNRILALVDRLQDAPVDDLAPMSHPMDMTQPLRADTVSEADVRSLVEPLAPAVQDHLYLVPRVIE